MPLRYGAQRPAARAVSRRERMLTVRANGAGGKCVERCPAMVTNPEWPFRRWHLTPGAEEFMAHGSGLDPAQQPCVLQSAPAIGPHE